MGVKQLWSLLSVAGSKLNPSDLRGLTLAIDASIWLVQFASVAERLEGVDAASANFELLLFFKRILKLLLLGVTPIVVFDGQPPALKRKTLADRFRQRMAGEKNYKKMAQRLVMNVLEQKVKKRPSSDSQTGDSRNLDFKSLTSEQEAGILQMLEEYENAMEERELEEDDVLHRIMIKENERLIKANGFSLEKFEKLKHEQQVNFIEYWKDMEAKEKRHQNFDNYEQASLKLLGDYLKQSEDQKKVKDYKAKLSEEIEKKRMSNLAVPANTNLQSLTRMEWNRQRVMYFFKKKEEEQENPQEDKDDIFNLRIKRKVFTRKEKEKKMDEERKKYSDRFERGANYESEIDGESNFEEDEPTRNDVAPPKPKVQPKPVRTDYDYDPNVEDMDALLNKRSRSASEDSLFKAEKSVTSEERPRAHQSENLSTSIAAAAPNDEFSKYLQAELSKIDREGGSMPVSNVGPAFEEGDSVKPILEDDRVKNRRYIPKGYFEKKMKPRIKRGNRKGGVEVSEDEEEDKFEREAMRQLEEAGPIQKSDWHTDRTNLETVFDEPLEQRMRRSRDATSQLMLSLGEEDMGSNRVVFDWLNKEDLDIGDFNFNADENSMNNSQTMFPPSRAPANILEFFSGGFLREDQEQSNEQVNRGDARIHNLRREFIEPKAPSARPESDPMGALKTMLAAMGVAWIQSPAEAEAQCAELESEGIADGTVTEDCDAFLFGSRRVFRGLFGVGRKPEEYRVETIEAELGLDREQLVMLALFLGCDYCVGIRGVGIVNAVEIVDAYSSIEALARFRKWAEKPDYWLDPDVYRESKLKNPKEHEFMQKHKNYKKEWELADDFPDTRVIDAFFHPQVTKNLKSKLTTTGLDVNMVVKYAKHTFRLNDHHLSLIEAPLKKELSKRTNPKIQQFFRPERNRVEITSNRLKSSLNNLRTVKLDHSVSDMVSRASNDTQKTFSRLSREGVLQRGEQRPSEESLENNDAGEDAGEALWEEEKPKRRKKIMTPEEEEEELQEELKSRVGKKQGYKGL